jgi:hypothetical protein
MGILETEWKCFISFLTDQQVSLSSFSITNLDLTSSDSLLKLEFRGGHDFFSLMVVGMGIVGIGIIAVYFVSFYTSGNFFILGLFSFYAISNGSLLDPVYHVAFIYIILIYIEKNDRKINNNHSHAK